MKRLIDSDQLPDPTGTSDGEFMEVIHQIEKEIGLLKDQLKGNHQDSVPEAPL